MRPVNRTLVMFGLLSASIQTTPVVPSSLAQSTSKADAAPSMIRAATIVERVAPDRRDIRVYEARRLVGLPWFTELAVAIPDAHVQLDSLLGSSVGLVPGEKSAKEWTLYTNVVGLGGDQLTLAENVFRVRKVIVCTPHRAVELHMDGWVYRLKPGQVLLALG